MSTRTANPLSLHAALPISPQHQFGQRPDQRIGAVGTAARSLIGAAGHHPTQLVLQPRKHSGVAHPARFIERGDRLGAGDLAAASVNEPDRQIVRSEEHTSELQSLMRISYAVFCLKK